MSRPMRDMRVKAVVWGVATDVGMTFVALAALGVILGVQATPSAAPQALDVLPAAGVGFSPLP